MQLLSQSKIKEINFSWRDPIGSGLNITGDLYMATGRFRLVLLLNSEARFLSFGLCLYPYAYVFLFLSVLYAFVCPSACMYVPLCYST